MHMHALDCAHLAAEVSVPDGLMLALERTVWWVCQTGGNAAIADSLRMPREQQLLQSLQTGLYWTLLTSAPRAERYQYRGDVSAQHRFSEQSMQHHLAMNG